MIALGVFLHSVGGFAAGTFYIPFKKVRNWAWESYWLMGGFFAWIVAPLVVAILTVPDLAGVLRAAPAKSLIWSYVFGLLWGVGGLTFGLSMRYLGMSLGYAIALGFCAVFGTIVPPVYLGRFLELLSTASGLTMLAGVAVCLLGISVCGLAGMRKEKELSSEQKTETIKEFDFVRGLTVAIFAGVMSACMAFGIAAGEPIAELATEHGVGELWQNSPVFVVVLLGGFTTNFFWCVFLNARNRSGKDYIDGSRSPLVNNYIFSAMAGVTWYFQFMFYGMGATKMGDYKFSSWTIHMAFIIVFSNMWGLIFREWKGCSSRTVRTVIIGILVVLFSTIVVGRGNYLREQEKKAEPSTTVAEGVSHGA